MANYFNTLSFRDQIAQIGHCRFMAPQEFGRSILEIVGKKIVILGCGAQGLNQGLNYRDSGLDVAFALRPEAISENRASYQRATSHDFAVGTFEEMIPDADIVINLTPDKQHHDVVWKVLPLLKKGATLVYAHGFNIVEEGEQIRPDITVIMVAPKAPGTQVRAEFEDGFGVPTLIAVHPANDPTGRGLEIAKALAYGLGAHRAGVLESSFVAEVKSDLMGEQTILMGVMQAGSIFAYDFLIKQGQDPVFAGELVQRSWQTVSKALKLGGLTLMCARMSNPARMRVVELADQLKTMWRPLFRKHMDDILSGMFSTVMMHDWEDGDRKLLTWREETGQTGFEQHPAGELDLTDQQIFDRSVLIVAFITAGCELAFETMVEAGIKPESAYYESLHELPLLANLIADKRLYELNRVCSDTAEYGNYLFARAALPQLWDELAPVLTAEDLGGVIDPSQDIDSLEFQRVTDSITLHPIEVVGKTLREHMTAMRRRK